MSERVNVRDLMAMGYCSPPCLLALVGEGECRCRCDGRGHGLLADAEVEFDTSIGEPGTPVLFAAPAMDCAVCGRRISKSRAHYIIGGAALPDGRGPDQDLHVIGPCCAHGGRLGSTRELHARLWPTCELRWHDFWDHYLSSGTRAGVASALGEWGVGAQRRVSAVSTTSDTRTP